VKPLVSCVTLAYSVFLRKPSLIRIAEGNPRGVGYGSYLVRSRTERSRKYPATTSG